MLKSLQEEKFGTGIFDKSKQVLKFGKKYSLDQMEKLYQFDAQIFRMAVYMDRLDKGLNKTDAALDARKWFIDYDISAPVIKVLKRSLVPFVSYTYRVTPLLAEAAALRPHKFAKWAAYGHVLNEGSAFLMKDRAGEDIDRLTMREEQTKKLFGEVPLIGEAMPYTNVRIPFNDSEGNALYFDSSRWIPGGDIFEQRESTVGVPFLPRPLQPSGLYFDFISNYFFKRDPFTGQTLEELGIDEDNYLEITKHFLKRIPPNMPFIKGTFAYNKYQKAKSIEAGEVEGEQVVGSKYTTADTPLAAIAYGLGFKLRPQNAEVNKLVKEALYQNEYKKLESERKKIITDFDKYGTAKFPTVEERDKELLKIDEEILKLAAEFEIYLNKLSELESKQEREQRVTGGLVSGPEVPDTKENPADRVDPFTGAPYSDQMARLGFNRGSIVDIQKVGNKSVRTYEDGSTEEIEIPEEIRNEPGLRMVAPIVELLGGVGILKGGKVVKEVGEEVLEKRAVPKILYHGSGERGLKEIIPSYRRTKTPNPALQRGVFTNPSIDNVVKFTGEKGSVYGLDVSDISSFKNLLSISKNKVLNADKPNKSLLKALDKEIKDFKTTKKTGLLQQGEISKSKQLQQFKDDMLNKDNYITGITPAVDDFLRRQKVDVVKTTPNFRNPDKVPNFILLRDSVPVKDEFLTKLQNNKYYIQKD